MKRILFLLMSVILISCNSEKTAINPTFEVIPIGKPAPNFKLMASDSKEYELKEFKGKWVVLEWTNFDCPFVKKHYNKEKKMMQTLQKKWTQKDVVWFSIISSAPGKQGYLEPKEAAKAKSEQENQATALLLDKKGSVGRLYAAKTTPQIYIIDPEGIVAYQGAADNIASTDIADLEKAQNYIDQALDAFTMGQKILISETQSYGCSVKY